MKGSCKKQGVLRLLWAFVLAVLGALAFSMKIEVSGFSKHANVTLADNTLLWSVLTGMLTVFYLKAGEKPFSVRDRLLVGIPAVIFGFLNVIGHSLYVLDSWDFLFGNAYQCIVGSASAFGYAALFYYAIKCVFLALDQARSDQQDGRCLCDRHPRLFPAVVIGAVLCLWLIVYFPGYTNNDINYQFRQFFGIDAMTNSHPVLSTVIMGVCMKAGKTIGSDALGLFLYMLTQAAMFTVAFSAVCRAAHEFRLPKPIRVPILLFYAVLPVWGAYSVQGMKDGLFASVFTLFVLYCLRFAVSLCRDEKNSPSFYVRFAVFSVLTALLRSKLEVIVAAVLVIGVLCTLRKKSHFSAMLGTCLVAVTMSFGFIYGLLPALGVIKCNNTESLSIPFQQVARIVREHPDEIERETIDAVLDYELLPEVYMPVLSDPVKDTYKIRDAADEAEKTDAFLREWKRLAKRYPADALQATLANVFGYFSFTPSIQTQNGHTGMCFFLADELHKGRTSTETYTVTYPKTLAPVRKAVLTAAYLYDAVPVLNLLYACAFYFWGVLMLTLYLLSRGGIRFALPAMAPLLLQIGCLGSSVNDCFRYEAPIAAAFPVLIIAAFLAKAVAAKR